MMQSHLVLMLIFALGVSAVFAGLLREQARDQLVIGAKMFGGMVVAALVLGWLMLPFPIQGLPFTVYRSPLLSLWIPVIAYMAMLFVFSSLSTLPSPPAGFSFYDAHIAAYAGLAALTARATGEGLRDVSWRAVLSAIVISSLYGVSDEYHQMFVPGRSFDVLDMVADAIGSVAGASAVGAWSRIGRLVDRKIGRFKNHGDA